jgi:hypothetical protein
MLHRPCSPFKSSVQAMPVVPFLDRIGQRNAALTARKENVLFGKTSKHPPADTAWPLHRRLLASRWQYPWLTGDFSRAFQ